MTNELEILDGIRSGNADTFNYLYKNMYPSVANYIKLNGGSEDEARDIFQDSVVVFYQKLQDSTFVLNCKVKTFIYSISRNLWLNELKSKSVYTKTVEVDKEPIEDLDSVAEESEGLRNNIKILGSSLDKLGEPCSSVLKMYYIEDLSMQEIAKKMNYTNAENAKNQKYKCLMRLKKIFFNRNLHAVILEEN